jgi:hypothetical protein
MRLEFQRAVEHFLMLLPYSTRVFYWAALMNREKFRRLDTAINVKNFIS